MLLGSCCWESLLFLIIIDMLFGGNGDVICHQITHHGSSTCFYQSYIDYLSARIFDNFEVVNLQRPFVRLLENEFHELWLENIDI